MTSLRQHCFPSSLKTPTGIAGFDGITGGGLPRGRTTLLCGGPGSGKTIFEINVLMHGAQECKESGIFVAFEKSPTRIVANFELWLQSIEGTCQ
jgi:circadian clock protein KaiC